MCGRMSTMFAARDAELQKKFMITKVMREFGPRYNVAPSQDIPVVVPGSRVLDLYKWGLIPHWAKDKDMGNKLINARAETLTDKPSFRESFMKRRCIVLCSGFYEWDGAKVPHHIQVKGEKIFALAGIFDEWMGEEGEIVKTCAIITCNANPFMEEIHHRMPVILKEEDYNSWLDTKTGLDDLQFMLNPIDSSVMQEYEVSTSVNSPKNDNSDVVDPVSSSDEQKKLF